MTIGKFKHTPVTRRRYQLDYSDWLAEGVSPTDTIASVAFASVPSTPTPAQVDASEINSPATSIDIFISGGVDGTDYKILITMTTVDGQVKQDDMIISCRNL
jgi:hypothetical protein